MTIPTRQAPPPPINQNRGFTITSTRKNQPPSRYTPTTDWDDKPFGSENSFASTTSPWAVPQQPVRTKKLAPPRPPPPKVSVKPAVPLKKPSTIHSNAILSNLLSRARLSKSNGKNSAPPKLPAPLAQTTSLNHHHQNFANYGSTTIKASASFSSTASSTPSNEFKLISFDSPPSSPTFTLKSNSDCVSVDSFSSDSNCSPANGFSSQAESGFEDDFVLDNKPAYKRVTAVSDPFDILDDPFVQPSNTKPPIAQKPVNVGNTSFYAFSGNLSSINTNNIKKPSDNYDPLCNGKDLIASNPTRSIPTIIRPTSAGSKGKISPAHIAKQKAPTPPVTVVATSHHETDEALDETLPSLPMPNIPPPPPPEEYYNQDELETESYGIALYDFDGEQDDDLSFKANEKIYLLRRLNNEWLFGRNKRGCEGMFPINFIEVKIPLIDDSSVCSGSSTPSVDQSKMVKVRALYDFNAETSEDLSLRVNDEVTVLYEINSEWLYGEIGDKRGQFPANFVDFIHN